MLTVQLGWGVHVCVCKREGEGEGEGEEESAISRAEYTRVDRLVL